ncbi:O-methyltransferase [Cytobacillus kochii]|uniref:O-methyltransferase n=1 Tax=Cytobacillus kochii TaxID=859143 RepID=UPI00204200B8|nr:O-methyltransferase [Cytobacillus kochii]MCM3324580.1 O-methyltransferase [Cytobacillus kochii]MCM3346973.1 O-methyltransferase [Cytobacillus kochii]MDM5208569.1 O-methyltransferase [Cytobacillus kochii]
MLNDELITYMQKLIPDRTNLFMEMEEYARENRVPIMELEGIEAMLQIVRIQQPTKILEIGTAIGYSALRMAEVCPSAHIITLERDQERYEKAENYFARSGMANQITLLKGDALEQEDEVRLLGDYDMIFIDAAKGQYKKFFEMYSQYLNNSGVIITDNVLFKGLVYEKAEIEKKRIRNLVQKIDQFNEWLMKNDRYHTVILPIGDGVAISRKK